MSYLNAIGIRCWYFLVSTSYSYSVKITHTIDNAYSVDYLNAIGIRCWYFLVSTSYSYSVKIVHTIDNSAKCGLS